MSWKGDMEGRASGLCCRYADGGAADDRNGGIGTVPAGCAQRRDQYL